MKVAIDARFFGPEGTGIGRYVEKLLENLEKIDHKNDYYILLKSSNFNLYNPKSKNFKKVLADANWYSLKEQILIPRILRKIKPDLVHFCHYNVPFLLPKKFIVTIYDLTKLEFGREASNINNRLVYFLKQMIFEILLRRSVKQARWVIAGSKTTKEKIVDLLSVEEDRIIPIYAGADDFIGRNRKVKQNKEQVRLLNKLNIKTPFVLYVGNAAPYKNIDVILESLVYLDQKISFVYVSANAKFVEKLQNKVAILGIKERVVFAGFLSNEDLSILYEEALAYIFPSISEGFGLPGLESMASGCPVICSNTKVFREVYSDAALFFDPKNPVELSQRIKSLITNNLLKESLIAKGKKQVEKYSWARLTRETLEVYKKTLSF